MGSTILFSITSRLWALCSLTGKMSHYDPDSLSACHITPPTDCQPSRKLTQGQNRPRHALIYSSLTLWARQEENEACRKGLSGRTLRTSGWGEITRLRG